MGRSLPWSFRKKKEVSEAQMICCLGTTKRNWQIALQKGPRSEADNVLLDGVCCALQHVLWRHWHSATPCFGTLLTCAGLEGQFLKLGSSLTSSSTLSFQKAGAVISGQPLGMLPAPRALGASPNFCCIGIMITDVLCWLFLHASDCRTLLWNSLQGIFPQPCCTLAAAAADKMLPQ